MIEIPEALTLARQMNAELRGKTVVRLAAASSPHKFAWYSGDPAEYPRLFGGRAVTGARAYGGKLLLEFEDGCAFQFSDGTTPRLYRNEKEVPKKHQLLIDFGDAYLVCTIRMYGGIMGFAGEFDNEYDRMARERPDVFSDAFSFDYFKSLLPGGKKKLSAKAFLATEQRIPGLGNGVLQDILFAAGVSPRRDVANADEETLRRLYDSVRTVLYDMTWGGGRDTEPDLYGNPGGYQTVMSRNNAVCPTCGGEIRREAFLGGNVYYCPACQK